MNMFNTTDSASERAQPEDTNNGQPVYPGLAVLRNVSVKGSGGVSATVVVTVRQGQVRMSIQPPFTWEAIMDIRNIDKLIRTLTLAAEGAKKMASAAVLDPGKSRV